jgi:hypothetical protein
VTTRHSAPETARAAESEQQVSDRAPKKLASLHLWLWRRRPKLDGSTEEVLAYHRDCQRRYVDLSRESVDVAAARRAAQWALAEANAVTDLERELGLALGQAPAASE